jgi:flavodoxin
LFLEYDLIGFGSGIYFSKPDPSLLDLIEILPKAQGKSAFVFSTRGRNSIFEKTYHKVLKEKLTLKGYNIVGQFSCRGFSDYHRIFKIFGGVNKGHPKEKEVEKAKTFAANLKKELSQGS